MLNFLELCADADAEVDMCIFLDSTTFLYRENQTGLVEVAARLFQQDPMAVVLQPPDMCLSSRASAKGVCKVGNSTTIKHGFFVVNRDRFEGFAPMPVESAGLGSVFEDIFAEGLTKGDHEGAVKQIRCGGAFFVHPYDRSLGPYACPHKNIRARAPRARPGHARQPRRRPREGGGGPLRRGLLALQGEGPGCRRPPVPDRPHRGREAPRGEVPRERHQQVSGNARRHGYEMLGI
ncbi:unnamed protein product [Prorocentrum cordatum]|uniref:Uncharacterized protein n=1 Tax=Prorocentrum cordatum TaxID=2364126 RepID=A0ABN9QDW0_9DINO|nr:unnamed protein product [Polarella glacialis]